MTESRQHLKMLKCNLPANLFEDFEFMSEKPINQYSSPQNVQSFS